MVKRIVALLLAGAAVLSCCSCQKTSVTDAERINASHPYVKVKQEEETKEEEPSKEQETIERTESAIKASQSKVTEIGQGETCTYNGYELTVQEVWLSKDLMLLDELEGNNKFREFLIAQHNLGKEKVLSEAGEVLSGGRQWIFIKINLKMVQEIDGNKEVCFFPMLYNKKKENVYSRISNIEGSGFDQYPQMDTPGIPHKDMLYYTFSEGEALDTILVMQVGSAEGILQDVYLSTGFLNLNGGGFSTTSLPEGSYMVRLNLVDNQVVKD